METKYNSLKEILNKTQKNLRNLTTSSLILLGIITSVIKQNKELKEQRHTFEMIYLNWSKLICEKNINFEKIKKNSLKSSIKTSDNFELADAVDFSISSMCSISNESFTDSALSSRLIASKKKVKNKLSGLFRKVTIAIIAANRLFFFNFISKSNRLCLFDFNTNLYYRFNYFGNKIKNSDTKINFSTTVCSISKPNDESKLKSLVNWLTLSDENEELNQLNQISNELNNYLFNEDICKINFYLNINFVIFKKF